MKRIVFTIACLCMCASPSSANSPQRRLYDCAANALYVFCSLTDNDISYSRSLELLPITKTGNSMLEFNDALKQCGYTTHPQIIKPGDLVKIASPFVVLNNTKDTKNEVGHYFVIVPNDGMATIYDYPQDIRTFPCGFLESLLKENGIDELPIIMCELNKPIDEKNGRKVWEFQKELCITNCNDKVIGQLDCGKMAEGGVLKCKFALTNETADAIVIKNVKADCSCSEVNIDKRRLNPGDTATISLEISLVHRYKETTIHGLGRIAKADGSQTTDLLLFVKAYSEPRVLVEPQKVKFGYIATDSGNATVKDAKITKTQYAENATITKIQSTDANISVSNVRRKGDVTLFDIVWDSTELVGLKNSKIEVFLGDEEQSASYFDIAGVFKMEFAIAPQIVIVKEGKTSEVTIASKDKKCVVNRVRVPKAAGVFDVSYSNEEGSSSVFIKLRDKVGGQAFIEAMMEVEITVEESEQVRLVKVPVVCVGHKS